jgi:hypothetical protein
MNHHDGKDTERPILMVGTHAIHAEAYHHFHSIHALYSASFGHTTVYLLSKMLDLVRRCTDRSILCPKRSLRILPHFLAKKCDRVVCQLRNDLHAHRNTIKVKLVELVLVKARRVSHCGAESLPVTRASCDLERYLDDKPTGEIMSVF